MFLQQRTKDTRTNNPIDQGVNMYSHDVVNVVVDDDVVVVVDDLELLQRWSPAGQLKLKLLNLFAVSTNIVLCDKTEQLPNIGSEIWWNFTSARSSFWNYLSQFLISRKTCLIRFKIFQICSHMEGEGKCRVLIMEISTLVKTALKSYYSMLSPLA